MKKLVYIALIPLVLTACSGGAHYNHPTVSGDVSKMSAETLCFRYASRKDEALAAEIDARGLDCFEILDNDPLYNNDPSDAMGGLRY